MKRALKLLLLFIIIFLLTFGLLFVGRRFFQNRASEPPKKESNTAQLNKDQRKAKQEALIDLIKEIFKETSQGTSFSLGVYDLKNKEYFGYNDTPALHAASVSKVLTAVVLLDKVEKGEIKLSDPMGAYNVQFQLEKMINISNQDSWDLIDAKLGIAPQEAFAKEKLGMTSVNMTDNLISVKDVTTLFTALAEGKVLNEASRERLFTYMQKTESEDFFSPVFNQVKATYYHKTGKYNGEGHDATFVEHPKYPFVLVLFTDNNTSPNLIGRGTVMTKTAQAVWDFFDSF